MCGACMDLGHACPYHRRIIDRMRAREEGEAGVIAWMNAWIERNPVKHARYLRRLNTKPRRRDHRGRFARG